MQVKVDRSTVTERCLALLSDRILTGELSPGTPVTEEAMAAELGVSRPTVREVFRQMLTEGLLTRNSANRVLRVTQATSSQIREGFIARRVIELQAAAAAATASPDAITKLREATEKVVAAATAGDVAELTRADIECHVATVGLLGSADLQEFYRRLLTKLKIVMAEGMRLPEEVADAAQVHQQFCDLVVAGDGAAAREQLAARLDESENFFLNAMELHV